MGVTKGNSLRASTFLVIAGACVLGLVAGLGWWWLTDKGNGNGSVAGATFAPFEPTYPISLGVGFDFHVPRTWGCVKGDITKHEDTSDDPESSPGGDIVPGTGLICRDEASDPKSGPGGRIFILPCPPPCGPAQQQQMRDKIFEEPPIRFPWETSDPTTTYFETTRTINGKPTYLIAMSHFWHRAAAQLDSQIVIQFSGPPSAKADLQKIVNDVRDATP